MGFPSLPVHIYKLFVEFSEELPQIATRLQVSNAELFNKYDRLLAEASLRINAPLPLTLLSILVIWQSNLP
jgi:hypothetical protein